MITLSIDAMSGDNGLNSTLPAAMEITNQYKDVHLIVVGDEVQIKARLKKSSHPADDRVSIYPTSETVEMTDSPAYALRKKKDSSMCVAINLVREGKADGCVSAGNTGALMAIARFVLKMIPGIDRPAICASLPRSDGFTYMLDLGANICSPPEILYQFGFMGTLLIQCLDGKKNPSVGLLNIGVEEIKGNDAIQNAAELFKKSNLNYKGFVEADEIYTGTTDLVVCDGFVGNIALKASEGVAQMIMGIIKGEFTRNLAAKGSALLSRPVLNAIKHQLDHRRYNGASFLGLRGTVVKSHGGTDEVGFKHAIEVAMEEVKSNLVNQIENALSSSAV